MNYDDVIKEIEAVWINSCKAGKTPDFLICDHKTFDIFSQKRIARFPNTVSWTDAILEFPNSEPVRLASVFSEKTFIIAVVI